MLKTNQCQCWAKANPSKAEIKNLVSNLSSKEARLPLDFEHKIQQGDFINKSKLFVSTPTMNRTRTYFQGQGPTNQVSKVISELKDQQR